MPRDFIIVTLAHAKGETLAVFKRHIRSIGQTKTTKIGEPLVSYIHGEIDLGHKKILTKETREELVNLYCQD